LSRWLVGSRVDAEDLVQEAYLRAFRHFHTFRGGDSRPWLLTIVRNTCFSWLRRNRTELSESLLCEDISGSNASNPEALLLRRSDVERLNEALEALPPDSREVLVLREFEQLSYKDIAAVVGLPIGTVMSRLARARKRMQTLLAPQQQLSAAGL
jgi:RNA polymerase sigma-70 factor (ECF subfamily)